MAGRACARVCLCHFRVLDLRCNLYAGAVQRTTSVARDPPRPRHRIFTPRSGDGLRPCSSWRVTRMKTFSVQTLGCKVNQYEGEQIATLLRRRGLVQVDAMRDADVRVVNSCSVTVQAASKSRQLARRAARLPVLPHDPVEPARPRDVPVPVASDHPTRARVIVTGCWATSDKSQAAQLPGVDAVIAHHDDVAAELDRLLESWDHQANVPTQQADRSVGQTPINEPPPKPFGDEGKIKE